MRAVVAVVGLITALGLTGSCAHDWYTAKPQASEVTIIDKDYTPGYYRMDCDADSKGSCSAHWVPPSWVIIYEDVAERRRVSVSNGAYDALRLGDRKVLNYRVGQGWWKARYSERFILGKQSAEKER